MIETEAIVGRPGYYTRRVRHESRGTRRCLLWLEARKWLCKDCGRGFRQRFEGILPGPQASEPLKREIVQDHRDGISRSRLARRQGIGGATVERWFQYFVRKLAAERKGAHWRRVLGIDEHFFTRRKGYATTFCNLEKHNIFDVVLGRSEATYRAVIRKHFPNARIVADRFHVVPARESLFSDVLEGPLVLLLRRHRRNLKPEQSARLGHYFTEHLP